MKDYGHLSFEERERIAFLRAEGLCVANIATELERSPGTIYRELARNSNADGSYRPVSAERRYLARRQRERIIDAHPALETFIRDRIVEGWTPEQISGWLEAGNENLQPVCFETIYDWLFAPAQKAEKLWKLLPTRRATRGRRKRRKTRSVIAGQSSIHERPDEVETRETVGHWEGDLMICKRTRPVLVLKERKSRFSPSPPSLQAKPPLKPPAPSWISSGASTRNRGNPTPSTEARNSPNTPCSAMP